MGSEFEGLSIIAMDFGIKTLIFDEMLLRDTRLMILGTVFVFICVWIYTTSIFLTAMTIISILFVVILTYFLYEVVYGIAFFPFMNILTVVICIGKFLFMCLMYICLVVRVFAGYFLVACLILLPLMFCLFFLICMYCATFQFFWLVFFVGYFYSFSALFSYNSTSSTL